MLAKVLWTGQCLGMLGTMIDKHTLYFTVNYPTQEELRQLQSTVEGIDEYLKGIQMKSAVLSPLPVCCCR